MSRTYGPADGSITVRVFKAGLLSKMGHDVELRLTRWQLTVDEDSVDATFDGTSLVVVGALIDGRVDPGALSAKDQRDILDNVRKSVFKGLHADRITFEVDQLDIDEDIVEGTGRLVLPPHRTSLDFEGEIEAGRFSCQVTVHQPDLGIRPYSAPLGVLKIKPDVQVIVDLPWG